MQSNAKASARPRVLLVDDEPNVTRALQLALRRLPYDIEAANSAAQALELLAREPFDVIVSDERMPGMSGSELLARVRVLQPDAIRIVLSGQASFDAALRAINGAEIYRFLVKPCPAAELEQVLREALTRRNSLRRFARWERDNAGDLALQTARFERVLEASWIAWQPIVDARDGRVYAHEALLRSDDAEHPTPERVLALAARAGRSIELGRRVRLHVADGLAREADANDVFVNVDPCDLADDTLVLGADELARHARRVVLEITERDTLAEVPDLDRRLASLRALGYRIAIDDLGGGYSGLTSLARVLPDIVKFDMELVRGIDGSPTRQRLLGPMVRMCRDMGIRTLAEGVETEGERTTVVALGCDLLQGFLLGRPERDARARQPGRDVVSAA